MKVKRQLTRIRIFEFKTKLAIAIIQRLPLLRFRLRSLYAARVVSAASKTKIFANP